MPSRILELIKKRVKLQIEEEPKPKTKEQQMNFGILKSSETPLVETKGIKPAQSSGETPLEKKKPNKQRKNK